MKFKIIVPVIILIITAFVFAETTFFDNPDESFIMSSLEQNTKSISTGGGGGGAKIVLADKPNISETGEIIVIDSNGKNITDEEMPPPTPKRAPIKLSYVFLLIGLGLFCSGCIFAYKHKNKFKRLLLIRQIKGKNAKEIMDKKIYLTNGNYIGKVDDLIIRHNEIRGLKIKTLNIYKPVLKKSIVPYKNVRVVGEIVIVDKKILRYFRVI